MKHEVNVNIDKSKIPEYVTRVTETLQNKGFEAYIVGGCVRDLIIGREPKDWDVATNAKPEEIQNLFEKTVYENKFGTVVVCVPQVRPGQSRSDLDAVLYQPDDVILAGETPNNLSRDGNSQVSHETSKEKYDLVEVTTYRKDGIYSDARHPDTVVFAETIEEDLARRDFTVNSMGYDPSKGHLKDIYSGLKDIKDMSLRTVGNPDERFSEDALRMLRAVRFSAELGFVVSHETLESIAKNASLLKNISAERIRDEFVKIIMSPDPMAGIGLLVRLGLNKYVVPELEEGIGCEQKGEHIYDVFEHILHALGHSADKKWPLDIRLSALFHDIGKPRTRRWDGTKAGGKGKYTFYGHEVIGARLVKKIMERLRFSNDLSEKVTKLVRYHMFFSDPEKITLSAVRRTIVNVGSASANGSGEINRDTIWDLMKVRECDRVGMKKKEAPYRLRKYHAMIEEALRAPTSVGMLKIDGKIMKNELGIIPGPRMGWILHALLEECLEDDSKNELEQLKSRVLELNKLSDKELRVLGEAGKSKKEETEEVEIKKLHAKHGVNK